MPPDQRERQPYDWAAFIVFAFLSGLPMDCEVFILARIRAEYDATDIAIVRGTGATGQLVTSTVLILFLGSR